MSKNTPPKPELEFETYRGGMKSTGYVLAKAAWLSDKNWFH